MLWLNFFFLLIFNIWDQAFAILPNDGQINSIEWLWFTFIVFTCHHSLSFSRSFSLSLFLYVCVCYFVYMYVPLWWCVKVLMSATSIIPCMIYSKLWDLRAISFYSLLNFSPISLLIKVTYILSWNFLGAMLSDSPFSTLFSTGVAYAFWLIIEQDKLCLIDYILMFAFFFFWPPPLDQWIIGTEGNQGFNGTRFYPDDLCSCKPADLHKSH